MKYRMNRSSPCIYLLITMVLAGGTYAGDFSVSPGCSIARVYYEQNPSTMQSMEYYITEFGLDIDFCYTIFKVHSFSTNAGIGGGGPSGALPLTYFLLGTSYQYGKKKTGFAAGPTIQLTSGGFAAGIKLSILRFDVHLFGFPGSIGAAVFGFTFG